MSQLCLGFFSHSAAAHSEPISAGSAALCDPATMRSDLYYGFKQRNQAIFPQFSKNQNTICELCVSLHRDYWPINEYKTHAMCFCAQVGLGTKFRSSLSSVWSHLHAVPAATLTSALLLMKQLFLNKFRSCNKLKTDVWWHKWDFKVCLGKNTKDYS